MKFIFEIRTDIGEKFLICAKNRKTAIEIQHYGDEDFIKKHCLIKNKGCAK